MVDYRKLISFGKSSYVISLPKNWIDKNKLLKGSLIAVREDVENLILSPKLDDEKAEKKEITINIDGKSFAQMRREIFPAYVNNFHAINIIGKELKEKAPQVREVLHNLMALEIMEQTSDKIIARDFVNMDKINMINLIRKMDVMTRSMLEDLDFKSKIHHENIAHRDEDINRIMFLLFRAMKFAMQNPHMMREYKVTPIELFYRWNVISSIEKISDEIKRIARFSHNIKLQKDLTDDLNKLVADIKTNFETIMKAFYNKDRQLAYKVADFKKRGIKQCDELYAKYWKREHLPNIIEKLRNMIVAVHTITRAVYA
ncbi:hypothetical protein KY328_03625 [Candidatus Woesearchaeota archaeon]|nr:hypothetical protein [Candidatus Woesearchaeota archaeon]MBW3021985.1 hypothetical protein [Candidatus Woesearchaeota archaeon]